MPNNALIPFDSAPPAETREESLSRQFYEWEKRGRGWTVYDYPVELEPPLVPLIFTEAWQPAPIDDGRRETFFSNLLNSFRFPSAPAKSGLQQKQVTGYRELLAAAAEPELCRYYHERFTELQIVLPRDLKLSKPVAENLLLSFSSASHPISFEVIGTGEKIVMQFAGSTTDAQQISQQLKSHLPPGVLIEVEDYLEDTWLGGGAADLIVDFGLANEFMLPLAAVSGFETDPLLTVTGALAALQADEVGVFQVIFQKTREYWAEEMISAVRHFDGTPFFSNAPEMVALTKEKIVRPLFAAVVRVAAKSRQQDRCQQIARNLGAGLALLANPTGNELIPLANDGCSALLHERSLLNRQSFRCGMILNTEELVSLVHPPSANIQAEKLLRESERTKPAPLMALNHPLILGDNTHQNETRQVSLSSDQRTRHLHLVGSSGSGKSTLLLNLIRQDLENGAGIGVIDPHGDLIDEVIASIPEHRLDDVVLFDPSDAEYPVGFNILQANSELEKNLLSSDLVATFRRMSTSWGDVMDSVLANAILAFVESSRGGTLFDLKRFLVEKSFRAEFLETVTDGGVRYFWEQEFPNLAGKPQSSILIRLDAFLRQKLIRNIVCQKDTRINFRDIIDGKKILLIKLAQGLIGEENSYLLGTLLVSKLYQTALSRQDSAHRPHFWLYLDEFHHFITPSMESILSGARKYNLGLTLAHQEFRQLQSRSPEVASSVLSNCYTRICFRLGDADAERFAGGFSFFDAQALQNLSVGEAIGRIERAEYDFNLKTLLPAKVSEGVRAQRAGEVRSLSRQKYAKPRAEVEAKISFAPAKDIQAPINIVKNSAPEISHSEVPERAEPPEAQDPAKPQAAKRPAAQTPLPSISQKVAPEDMPALPDNPPLPPKEPTSSDAGSQSHRYLQSLVKRMAENRGFLATVEKEVFGGSGRIDVALESGSRKIACEISVTNEPAYEVQNIRKCLAAGFAPVLLISQDARHLEKIRRKAQENLSQEEISEVYFFAPEEFYAWLENAEAPVANENSSQVNGFKVNVKFKPVDETDRSSRKKAISDVMLGALKRLQKKPPKK